MNRYIQFIKERRSIRDFRQEMPKDEEILQLIEAAGYAPSPTNLQPWRFLIVKSETVKRQMAAAMEKRINSNLGQKNDPELLRDYCHYFNFFQNAPVVVVPLYRPYPSFVYSYLSDDDREISDAGKLLSIMSVSAATQNLLLAAHALGLGGCWMHGPLTAREELKEILVVREPWEILAVVPIGVPAVDPKAPRRKKVGIITKFIE